MKIQTITQATIVASNSILVAAAEGSIRGSKSSAPTCCSPTRQRCIGGTLLLTKQPTMNYLQLASDKPFKAPASATGRERCMAIMADVTNVLAAGMINKPPNVVRRVTASVDFANIIYHVPTIFFNQDCSPPWQYHGDEQQPSHQSRALRRRASHRRLHAMDWTDIVTSTTQAYSSHYEGNGANRPTPTQKFEQLRTNTLCNQRKSRSCEFSSHAQRYPSSSSSSSKKLYTRHHCSQNYQVNATPPSCIVPSNIYELTSDLNAKAKLLSREEEEHDDLSSLDYSDDDDDDDECSVHLVSYGTS